MSKFNILLVDDEPNVLKSLKRIFIETDYHVLTAGSGKEGLEICTKEELALVISDYRMPEMNGVQFLAKVRELHPNTIRIILSGYADVSAIVEAINDGQVYRFLSKPWNDEELLDTVRHSLEHYRLREENTALLAELQIANDGLKDLTDGLERKVESRTRDLELKTRAVQVAHRILNQLPAGVIGIDNQGTVVYMNAAIKDYISADNLAMSEQIDWSTIGEPLIQLKTQLESESASDQVFEGNGIRLICTSLPDQSGIVGLFSYVNPDDYKTRRATVVTNEEVAHAD